MGDIVGVIPPEHLAALKESMALMNRLSLELGLVKRGHQHLWNEIGKQYQVEGKIEVNYDTGVIRKIQEESHG
jgi:hypothetical protein